MQVSNTPSASASEASPAHSERQYKTLRISLNVSILAIIAGCALIAPDAGKRDQQWKLDQALTRCEQGFNAYCKQVAFGGNYAH